jgi:hypothetical protein
MRFGGSDRFEVQEKTMIEVDSLDHLLETVGNPRIDFLKIDTQGTELDVLKGSVNTIRRSVIGAEVEVNFFKRYIGQAFFSDIDTFLRGEGFMLFDIARRYTKYEQGIRFGGEKGQLMKGDALYLSSFQRLRLLGEEGGQEERKRLVVGAMAIASIYGYLDYSREILEEFAILFTAEERQVIEMNCEKFRAFNRRIPAIPGRHRFSRWMNSLSRMIRPPSGQGSFGDDGLGNVEDA